jgi:hypothetical protein
VSSLFPKEKVIVRKKILLLYSCVTYAIARSGGAASFAVYIMVQVVATLTTTDQQAEAVPAAAPVPELALEEVVAPPPVVIDVPGVCT